VERALPEPWTPSPAQLFDLAMLVLLGGRERTVTEYRALLSDAGWKLEHVIRTGGPFSGLQAVAV
jgi:hypothetical protein